MSLKFGIYLVEQRIISPEQFCGLVKIQQQATMSLPTIAIRKNFLTIKQVARVLDILQLNSGKSFTQVAMQEELFDSADADRLLQLQQMSCPSIEKLLVECGLLTSRQTEVLSAHFQRQAECELSGPELQSEPDQAPITPERKFEPRQPKFTQRPVAAHSHSNLP